MLGEAELTDFSSTVFSLWQAFRSEHPVHAGEKAGHFIAENVGRLYDGSWETQFDLHQSVSPLLNIGYVRADLADALGDVAVRLVWLTKGPRQPNLNTARDACRRYLQLAGVELPERSTERGEGQIDDQAAVRLLSVFTNSLADERFGTAANVLQDGKLTVNEKLTKIDELIPFPPTASATKLGKLVGGVTKQAVMKTEWWIKNRKGEREKEIDRRREKHRERAKQHEPDQTNDEDD